MLKGLSKAGLIYLTEPDPEKRATERSSEPEAAPQYTAGGWRKNTQGIRGYSSLMLSTFYRPFPFVLVAGEVGA